MKHPEEHNPSAGPQDRQTATEELPEARLLADIFAAGPGITNEPDDGVAWLDDDRS